MLMTHLNTPASRQAPARARGFGLLQVLLLISVIAGLAAMGYLQWRERSAIDSSRQERQALAQADRAIINFATVLRRMPCPDVDRDGLEDCAAGDQKGWLPSVSLQLAGADPGVGVGQLRYLVQRGGGANDLTVLTDAWRPLEYNTTGRTFASMRETPASGTYQADILTLTDLCQRLEVGRTTPYAAGMAEVRAPTVRSVAYALVHPGNDDADGNNSVFDGANASADPAVEDPARRPLLATYNDIVLERSHLSLLISFHCQPLIDSINTVALAHDVVEQVDELREGNIDSAKQAIVFAALTAGITAIETTATVLEGISEAGNAAAAWALCAATLGLAVNACAAAPQHTAAIALTGGVVAANAVSVGLNIAAAVMAGNALALADSSVNAADLTCPAVDLTQAINAATAEVTNATNDRNAIAAELATRRNELTAANIARTNAVNTLVAQIRRSGLSSSIDGLVQPLLDAANTWETRSFAVNGATQRRDNYQNAVNNWTTQVNNYANMIANRTTMLAQLDADIAALDLQIAATSDPAVKESLQVQRLEKTSQRTLLSDPVALQKEYDDAVAARASAQANLTAAQNDLATAQSNLGSAQSSYQTAYSNLLNAGRYTTLTAGLATEWACTSTFAGVCQPGDAVTTGAILAALNDLLGTSSASPDPDAKYLRPIKIQRMITALESQLAKADTRITDAQNQLTQLQTQAANPPPCNITGRGVTPMPPDMSMEILIQVDQKGGTR
ncbi:hypothetical protein [Acidovorax kalamii]|uniref:hypothetical protein n=1 Tax=Acidovorax kalamii TaxID=2004485 RepID=UPI0020919EBB|nr:hypothetical protein [Acidovorax kalamii]MCO5355443.1 hypothetical protein [Acidovorax kalamii]